MSEQSRDDGRRHPEPNGRYHGNEFFSGDGSAAASQSHRLANHLAAKLQRALSAALHPLPFRDRDLAAFAALPSAEGVERAARWAKGVWGGDAARATYVSLAGSTKQQAAGVLDQLGTDVAALATAANGPPTLERLVAGGHVTLRKDNWHRVLVLVFFAAMFVAMLAFDVFALGNLAATTGDVFTKGIARGLALTLGVSLSAFIGGTLFLFCCPKGELLSYLRPFSLAVFGVGVVVNVYFNAQLGYAHSFDPAAGDIPPPLPATWMCGLAGGVMGIVLVSLEYLIKATFETLLPRETVINDAALKAQLELPHFRAELSQWQVVAGLAQDLLQRLVADRTALAEQVVGGVRRHQQEYSKRRSRLEHEVKIANAQNQLKLLDDAA